MDAETLKIVLDLNRKVVIYERILSDLLIATSADGFPMLINYGLDAENQGVVCTIFEDIQKLKAQSRLMAEGQNNADNRNS